MCGTGCSGDRSFETASPLSATETRYISAEGALPGIPCRVSTFLRQTFGTQSGVWRHRAMVAEVPLATPASLAKLAARVESRFEVFPRMVECPGWFVLFAGRASVRPGFRRALVAHPAAFPVLPQLVDLESFVARAASTKGILVLELTRAADVGLRGEVPRLSLLRASGA